MSKNIQWVVGILAVFTLMLALLVFSLYRATEREMAVNVVSLGMSAALSPKGVDDATDIKMLLATTKAGADGMIQPIPGLALKISKDDIVSLPPRDARALFMRPLAEKIYDAGDEGLASLATSPSMGEAVKSGAGFLKLISADTHALLLKVSLVLLAIPVLLLFALLSFSRGRSRFTSAGWSLIFGSIPGLVIFTLALLLSLKEVAPASLANGFVSAGAYIASIALSPVFKMIVETYAIFFIAGVVFLIVAFVWRLCASKKQTVIAIVGHDDNDTTNMN